MVGASSTKINGDDKLRCDSRVAAVAQRRGVNKGEERRLAGRGN